MESSSGGVRDALLQTLISRFNAEEEQQSGGGRRAAVNNICEMLPRPDSEEGVAAFLDSAGAECVRGLGSRHLVCSSSVGVAAGDELSETLLYQDMNKKCEIMLNTKTSQSVIFTGSSEAKMTAFAKRYLDLFIGKKLGIVWNGREKNLETLRLASETAFLVYNLFGDTSYFRTGTGIDSYHSKVIEVHFSAGKEEALGINYHFHDIDHNRALSAAYGAGQDNFYDVYSFILASLSKDEVEKFDVASLQKLSIMRNETCFSNSNGVNLYNNMVDKLRNLGYEEADENELKAALLAISHLHAFIYLTAQRNDSEQTPPASSATATATTSTSTVSSGPQRISEVFKLTEAMESHLNMAQSLLGFQKFELANLLQINGKFSNSTTTSTYFGHSDMTLCISGICNEIHSRLFHGLLSFCSSMSYQACCGKTTKERRYGGSLSFSFICLPGWKDSPESTAAGALAAFDIEGGGGDSSNSSSSSGGGGKKPTRRVSVAQAATAINSVRFAKGDFFGLRRNYTTEMFHSLIFDEINKNDSKSDKIDGKNKEVISVFGSNFAKIIGNARDLGPTSSTPLIIPLSEAQKIDVSSISRLASGNDAYNFGFDDDNSPVLATVQHSFGNVTYDLCRFRKDNVYSYSEFAYPPYYSGLIETRHKGVSSKNVIFMTPDASLENISKFINMIDFGFIKDYLHNEFELPSEYVVEGGRLSSVLERTKRTCETIKKLLLSQAQVGFCFCLSTAAGSNSQDSLVKQIRALNIAPLVKACYMASSTTINIRSLLKEFEEAVMITRNISLLKDVYAEISAIDEQQKKSRTGSQLAETLTSRWFTTEALRVERALWTIFKEILFDITQQPFLIDSLASESIENIFQKLSQNNHLNLFWFDNSYSCIHLDKDIYSIFQEWNTFKLVQIEYSITKMQAQARSALNKRRFVLLKYAVNIIKSRHRMKKVREQFEKSKKVHLIIKNFVLKNTLMKKALYSFTLYKEAGKFIKRNYMIILWKKRFKKWIIFIHKLRARGKLFIIQQYVQKMSRIALRVKRLIKRYVASYKLRKLRIKSAVIIQQVYRGFNCRDSNYKIYQTLYLKKVKRTQRKAATKLQCLFRMQFIHKKFSTLKDATLRLQTKFRSYSQSKLYKAKRLVSLTLQSHYRRKVAVARTDVMVTNKLLLGLNEKIDKIRKFELDSIGGIQGGIGSNSNINSNSNSNNNNNSSSSLNNSLNSSNWQQRDFGGIIIGHCNTKSGTEKFARMAVGFSLQNSNFGALYYDQPWLHTLSRFVESFSEGSAKRHITSLHMGSDFTIIADDSHKLYGFGIGCVGMPLSQSNMSKIGCPSISYLEQAMNAIIPVESAFANSTKKSVDRAPLLSLASRPLETIHSIMQMCCGKSHVMMLSKSGHVYSWGSNNVRGQLGHSNFQELHVPRVVEVIDEDTREKKPVGNVIQISCGEYHSICLVKPGCLYAWGAYECLGRYPADFPTLHPIGGSSSSTANLCADSCIPIPVYLTTPNNVVNKNVRIQDAVCGCNYVIARSGGDLFSWGKNVYCNLGYDTSADFDATTGYQLSPRRILFPKNTVSRYSRLHWQQSRLLTSGKTNAFLAGQSDVWVWGWNKFGQLGNGDTKNGILPTKLRVFEEASFRVDYTVIDVALGNTFSALLVSVESDPGTLKKTSNQSHNAQIYLCGSITPISLHEMTEQTEPSSEFGSPVVDSSSVACLSYLIPKQVFNVNIGAANKRIKGFHCIPNSIFSVLSLEIIDATVAEVEPMKPRFQATAVNETTIQDRSFYVNTNPQLVRSSISSYKSNEYEILQALKETKRGGKPSKSFMPTQQLPMEALGALKVFNNSVTKVNIHPPPRPLPEGAILELFQIKPPLPPTKSPPTSPQPSPQPSPQRVRINDSKSSSSTIKSRRGASSPSSRRAGSSPSGKSLTRSELSTNRSSTVSSPRRLSSPTGRKALSASGGSYGNNVKVSGSSVNSSVKMDNISVTASVLSLKSNISVKKGAFSK